MNLFNSALLSLKEGERIKGLFWKRIELRNTASLETDWICVELKKPRKLVSSNSARSNVPLTEILSSDEQKIDESDDPARHFYFIVSVET